MRKILLFALFLVGISATSQTIIQGRVIDQTTKEAIPFASVYIENTTIGTATGFDGDFSFSTSLSGNQNIVVQSIGYTTLIYTKNLEGPVLNLGEIAMASESVGLEGVTIVGVADIAKDRQTPVAVSTIKASEIQQKLGSQELPELLNNTPSVYATKQGGGFGDARINIRGFSQENIAVMINGVPVNDMENSSVYWSNWSGLADVTTAMQVQRGLGSSKLAISSVGGTINILTKTTDVDEGGRVGMTVGNDGYSKIMYSYSTGKMPNKMAASFLFSRTSGSGYVRGTDFEGYNYFVGVGYEPNVRNNFQFVLTGAPQMHNQRTASFYNMATLDDYLKYGKKYNYNFGLLHGEEFNWRKNFYHKPVTSVNWDFNITEKSRLSTVLYASFGRGGGTGDLGRIGGKYASDRDLRDVSGQVQFDNISLSNSGENVTFSDDFSYGNEVDPVTGTYIVNDADIQSSNPNEPDYLANAHRRNGLVRRASMNSHNWVGIVSNFNTQLVDNLTLDVGIDLRKYKGFHYRRLDNLLGADGYRDNNNVNNPMNVVSDTYDISIGSIFNVFGNIDKEVKVDYYNIGKVKWYGAFSQLEYSKNKISMFVQGAVSSQNYQRVDYFRYAPENQTSDQVSVLGGNIKGGLNYNIDEKSNVFFNTGTYSKQPGFDAVFLNNTNDINPDIVNEKVFGLEFGYGFRSKNRDFTANVNYYYTTWKNRYLSQSTYFPINDSTEIEGFARIQGVTEIHKGVEVDLNYKASEEVTFYGMISLGDWFYSGNASGPAFDENQEKIGDITVYLDGVKVGNSAQTSARLGLKYEPIDQLYFDANWRYVDRLYARLFLDDFQDPNHKGSLELPSYNLLDAGISYRLLLGEEKTQNILFRLNVNNVMNTEYISESATNYQTKGKEDFSDLFAYDDYVRNQTYNDIDKRNKVFFGFGRTWNFGMTFRF